MRPTISRFETRYQCFFLRGKISRINAPITARPNAYKQTVDDAVEQYKRDRNLREKLFDLDRCIARLAVDEAEARFCTHLKGKTSWFLPFNRGWNDGAGNPPNPGGARTDYLRREVLTRESLTGIPENYAQLVEQRDEKTGRKTGTQI